MREETILIDCVACGRNLPPSQTDWDLFRIGVYVHNECVRVYNNLDRIVRSLKGDYEPNPFGTGDASARR